MNAQHLSDTRFVGLNSPADLSVIVVTYNSEKMITRCIDCLRDASTGLKVRVIIVDNASRDASVAVVKAHCGDCILVENSVNVGFGRANNQVLALCDANYVLLLNPDAFVEPDTVAKSLEHIRARAECGILGVKLVGETGKGGNSAYKFPSIWADFARRTGIRRTNRFIIPTSYVDCDWVPGCFYLIRKQVLDQVGLFDPRYFLYFEEVDHCLAAKRAGWKVQYLPTARVIHEGGASALSEGLLNSDRVLTDLQLESELLFFRKHQGRAGAFAAVALGITADLILAAKWLLKGRPWRQAGKFLRNSQNLYRIARQSGLGSRSSR